MLASRSRVPRPVALRVAIVIAGVGLMGTVSALARLASTLATGAHASSSLVARASMALVLLVYLAFAISAFVRGARARGRA